MLFSKKNRIESSHCAFTFYFLNIAPLHQKDNTIHANSCFSALLLIALSSNYIMCSKPLYHLLLIFFLAAVPFIYFDRAFMILCAHRAQLCGKIRLFCCIFLCLLYSFSERKAALTDQKSIFRISSTTKSRCFS